MLERIGALAIIVGTLLGLGSVAWLLLNLIRVKLGKLDSRKLRRPLYLLLLSIVTASAPIVINSIVSRFISLGPLNTIVAGERHLTLTGWDRHDYSLIASHNDTIVLQMANTDVTDETLQHIQGMTRLRELDLSNSKITDRVLAMLAPMKELRDLRLARTKITEDGFREFLLDQDGLMNLDLTGTAVASKTVREWKAKKPDRRVLK